MLLVYENTMQVTKQFLNSANVIGNVGISRCFHIFPPRCSNMHRKTRFQMMCELNKTLYIHRNAEFGPQPIFYRGPNKAIKVDLWQRHLDKQEAFRQWKTYSRQAQTGEAPVDDVYLASLYKSPHYSIREAVETLRENTRLDFTDPESPILLRLNLDEITRKVKKKKRPLLFFKTTPPPHPSGLLNKVCLFTGNEAVAAAAQKMGVHAVGTSDVITQLLRRTLRCDAFYATADCLSEVTENADLKKLLGHLLPTKRFNLIADVQELHAPINDIIYHNHVDLQRCDVIVGVPRQPSNELEENIRHVFDAIHQVAVENRTEKIINSASLSCFTEPLQIDPADIRDDV